MFQDDSIKIGLAEHTLCLQVQGEFLFLVKEAAVLQFQVSAPFVALRLNLALVYGSHTGRKNKLVHQFIRHFAFVSTDQTRQVKHGIDVEVRPHHLVLPIRRAIGCIHGIPIGKTVLLFAEAFGVRHAELGFDADTRRKPFTDTYAEIGRHLFRKASQCAVIAKECMPAYIAQHKPVCPKTVCHHTVSVIRWLCLRKGLARLTYHCITFYDFLRLRPKQCAAEKQNDTHQFSLLHIFCVIYYP